MEKSKKYSYGAAVLLTVVILGELYQMVYASLYSAKLNSENFFVSFFKNYIWLDQKGLDDFYKNSVMYSTIMIFLILLIAIALFCRSRLFLLIDFIIVFLAFTFNFINWLAFKDEDKKSWAEKIDGYKVTMIIFAFVAALLVALFLILSAIGLLTRSKLAIVFSAAALVVGFARLVFEVLIDIIPIYKDDPDAFFKKLDISEKAAKSAGMGFQGSLGDIINVAFLFAFMLFTIHRVRELNANMNVNTVAAAGPVAAAPFYAAVPAFPNTGAQMTNYQTAQNMQFAQSAVPVQNVQPVAPAPAPAPESAPKPEPVQIIPETIDLNPGEVMYTAEEAVEKAAENVADQAEASVEAVADSAAEAAEEIAVAAGESVADVVSNAEETVSEASDSVADAVETVLDDAETGLKEIKDDIDPAEAEKLAELTKMYEDM